MAFKTYKRVFGGASLYKTPLSTPQTSKIHTRFQTWGPFLQSPGNFTGPKSKIQIEIKRIRARVLAIKLLHFVSLLIVLSRSMQNYWNVDL